MRSINTAYEAWRFLHEHPSFVLRERNEITSEEAASLKNDGWLITQDTGGKCYREWRHNHRHAIHHNLEIEYVMVDESGHINTDPALKIKTECWLEFGQELYDYPAGTDGNNEWDNETTRLNCHDPDLDTGGSTFDEAIVKLANLVLGKYGDYEELDWTEQQKKECGNVVPCADCRSASKWMEKFK
jgi:hypothetical protein